MLTVSIISVKAVGAATDNSALSEKQAFDWYCNKVKDGKAPPLPSEFSFINDNGGYYIDCEAQQNNEKVIYLTFDCGYENGNIERILDTMKAHNVKGAFFVLGNLITSRPELVTRMADEGHLVCNHTYSHRDMTKTESKEDFEKELNRLNDTAKEYCNITLAPFYRPPQGRFNLENIKWANELGYKSIFWSCAYDDWDNNRQMSRERALEKLYSRVHCGEILLLHPTSKTNADILDEFLTTLENQGYVFKSLSEL